MINGLAQEPFLNREPDADVLAFHHLLCAEISQRRLALWFCREKMFCIFMLRIVEDFPGRTGFDDLPFAHHTNPIGDFAHDTKIMGDEEHRHALSAFKLCEKL